MGKIANKSIKIEICFIFVVLLLFFVNIFVETASAADNEVTGYQFSAETISVPSDSAYTSSTIVEQLPDFVALTYGTSNAFTTAEITNWACVAYDSATNSYIPSTFDGTIKGEYIFKASFTMPTGYVDAVDTIKEVLIKVKVEQYYTVEFDKGNASALGTAPNDIYVAEGTSIVLPENTFTYGSYLFKGWNDGKGNTIAAGCLYTVTGNIALNAAWNEIEINGYSKPSDVSVISGTYTNLSALLASGVLPSSVQLSYGDYDKIIAQIDSSTWTGSFNGSTEGVYTLSAKFIMPDGYTDADASILNQIITISVNVNNTIEISGYESLANINVKVGDYLNLDTILQSGILPSTVTMTYGTEGKIDVAVTSWSCTAFDGNANGNYTFVASYVTPGGYTVSASISNITVTVNVSENYVVQFASGNATATGVVSSIPLTTGDSVILPTNGFSLSGYEFTGWSDGTNTYNPGQSYTVSSNVTLTAVWAKIITKYTALEDIYVGVNEYSLADLINKLPSKITIYGAGYSTTTSVTWTLKSGQTYDANAVGTYSFVGTYSVPAGYVNPVSGPLEVTINASLVYNKYYIYDNGGQIIVANDNNGLNAKTYSTESEITIQGTDADDTFYFNILKAYSALTSIVIDGKGGKDTITTSLPSNSVIDSKNVNINLNAERILFEVSGLAWNMNSLTINAKPDSSYLAQLLNSFQSTDIVVSFSGISVIATGNVTINADADVTSKLLDFADGAGDWIAKALSSAGEGATTWTADNAAKAIEILSNSVPGIPAGTADTVASKGAAISSKIDSASVPLGDTVDSTLGQLANAHLCIDVKPVSSKVNINNSNITASNVSIKATTKIGMFTLGLVIPIVINIATVEDSITISGDSVITATNGDITLNTNVDIDADSKVYSFASVIPINFSLGVTLIDSTSQIIIEGSTKLNATGSIHINSINTVNASTSASCKSSNDSQSGVVVTVAVINQNTGVNIKDTASLDAGGDINVSSTETCVSSTSAVAGKANTGLEMANKNSYSVSTIKSYLSSLKDVNGKNIFSDTALAKIGDSFNDAAAATDQTTINITVYDTDGKTAITGATVQLTDPNKVVYTAVTNAKGIATFSIDSAVPGTYKFVITQLPSAYAGRTLPAIETITVETGKNTYVATLVLGTGKTYSAGSGTTNASQTQLVGTFAVEVIVNNNISQITTTGLIKAGGNVNIVSYAVTNNTSNANSNTIAGKNSSAAAVEYKVYDENGNALKGVEVSLTISLKPEYSSYISTEDKKVFMYDTEKTHTFKAITNASGIASFILQMPSTIDLVNYYTGNKIGSTIDTTHYNYVLSVTKVPTGEEAVYSIPTSLQNINIIFNSVSATASTTTYNYSGSGILTFKDPAKKTGTTGKSFGGGVAIAINVVNYENKAIIGDNVTISAAGLTVLAKSGDYKISTTTYDNLSSTSATAGYNVGNFGIGGAIAVNVYLQETLASIANSAKITLNNGNLSVQALDKSSINTFASASQTGTIASNTSTGTVGTTESGTTDSTGVGSGIAVSIYTNKVNAYIGGTINGSVKDASIVASSTGTNTTYASAGSSGGKALVPVVALDISYADVEAVLASNATALTVNGNMVANANSSRTKKVTSTAKAAGESVAAGGAFNVSVDSYSTIAQIARAIFVGGSLQVTAYSDNASSLITYAGANGAAAGSSGPTTTQTNNSTSKVDNLTNSLLTSGQKLSKLNANNGVPGTTPQSASTTEGSVNIAGAVTVAVFTNYTVSSILSNATVKDALIITALSNNDVLTQSDASATNSTTGVGVAVAIQVDNIMTQAFIGANTTIKTASLTVKSGIAQVSGDDKNTIQIKAISGAGASNVGVAGAIAIGIINIDQDAFVHSNAITVTSGDFTILAMQKNEITNQAGAAASVVKKQTTNTTSTTTNTKSVGVGASFALTIASTDVLAYVGADKTLMLVAGDVIVKADLNNVILTTSEAGESAGYSDEAQTLSNDALDAGVAVVIISSDIKAAINQGVALIAGGNLIVNANTKNTTNTVTQGSATASNVAAGGSVTVNIIYEDVLATLAGNAALGGNASITASAATVDISTAYATAAGLILENYANKLNTTIANLLNGQYLKDKIAAANSAKAAGSAATQITQAKASAPSASEVTNVKSNIASLFTNTNTTSTSDKVLGNLYTSGSSYSTETSLSSAALNSLNVKTTNVSTDTTNIVDNNNITTTNASGDTSTTVKTNASGTTTTSTSAGTTSSGSSIAIAAAVGVNIISHDVQAIVTGNIIRAKGLLVSAQNNNDFQTLGTGAAVSNDKAIAVGVAVMINNSTTKALLAGNVTIVKAAPLSSSDTITNNVIVKASTVHNLGAGFTDQISAQAIAGAAKGSGSGIGAAGAIAVLVSNAKTIAQIQQAENATIIPVVTVANGDVSVNAYEKSKLAVRAWAASISSTLINGLSASNSATGALSGAAPSTTTPASSSTTNKVSSKAGGSGVAVGAAFAILTSQEEIKAYIGDGVKITANNIAVIATKANVNPSDYDVVLSINGYITIGNPSYSNSASPSSTPLDLSKTYYINTTNQANNTTNKLSIDKVAGELLGEGLDLLNILATNNYYVEAAGGSASTDSSSSATVAGSFAVIYYSNDISAAIGDGVTITFNSNGLGELTVAADSDISTIAIAGALAYGGSTSVGLTAVAVSNCDKVNASIGTAAGTNPTIITGQKVTKVDADLTLNIIMLTVAAATSGTSASGKAIEGVIGAIVSDNKVTALLYNSKIYGTGNISVTADNDIHAIAILGGASYGSSLGIGASIGVNVISNTTQALVGDGVVLGETGNYAGNVLISANASEWILDIVLNGSASSSGVAVAASPACNIINTDTYAMIGNAIIYANNLDVLANGDTWLLTIAGAVSVSKSSAAVGGSVDVIILSKDVHAIAGTSDITLYINEKVNVKAISEEDIIGIVVGCSVGSKVSAAGSIVVTVVENDVIAKLIGDGTINGDVNVWATDDILLFVAAGGVGVSTSGAGVGFANSDIIFSNNTKASLIGVQSNSLSILGNVIIKANAVENIYSFVIPVAVANSAAVAAGINVIVMNESTWSSIGGIVNAGSISLDTDDNTNIVGFILGVAASSTASIGGGIETIVFNKNTQAFVISQSQLNATTGSVVITADSIDDLLFVVIGVSGSGKVAVNGSIAVVYVKDIVKASVESGTLDNNTIINVVGNFVLTANNDIDLRNLVGNVSGSGSVAVGGAIHTLIFSGNTESSLGNYVTLTAGGTVSGYSFYDGELNPISSGYNGGLNKSNAIYNGVLIGATTNQSIDVWVISGAGSGTAAVAGSVNVITFDEDTFAGIGQYCTVTSAKGIAVIALDESQVTSQVGQAAGSGSASIGVGADTLYFKKDVTSSIAKGSTVKANGGNLLVIANSYEFLRSLSVGISISGSVSVNGSASIVVLDNKITAFAGTQVDDTNAVKTVLESYGSTVVKAEDYQELLATSGAASFSGSVAVGAGASVITANQNIKSYLGSNTTVEALGNIGVQFYTGTLDSNKKKVKGTYYGLLIGAFNTSDILQIVFSASASQYAGVAVASATLINNAQTTAKINSNASVNQGNREYNSQAVVRVTAVSTSDSDVEDAGAAGGSVGVSVAAVLITNNKVTTACIDSTSLVYATAGIAVLANNYNNVLLVGASLGGGIAGVSGAATIYILTDKTIAYISGTTSTKGAIQVLADSTQNIVVTAGSASIGGVAVGGSSAIFTFNGTTKAYVATGSTLTAGGSVTIQANANEIVTVVSAAGALATSTAVAGSLALSIINMTVQAYTENYVTIIATGALLIKAVDDSTFVTTSDSVSYSAGVDVGAGGAGDVFIYRNTVTAYIGNNNTVSASSITVQAKSNRNIDAYTAAGAGGGSAGISGSIVVLLVGSSATDSDTSTSLGSTGSNADSNINNAFNSSKLNFGDNYSSSGLTRANEDVLAAQNRMSSLSSYFTATSVADKTMAYIGDGGTTTATIGSITVEALEATDMTVISGSLSGGTVGVGGAVAIALFNGTTEARIGGTITAIGDINVNAQSTVTADKFYTVAGSVGIVGIGASVTILIISGTSVAYINSGELSAQGNINVTATLYMTALPFTAQASLGGIAVGISSSTTKLTGTVKAYQATGTTIVRANTVTIKAKGNVNTSAKSTAVAGGIKYAGDASVATILISESVLAYASGTILNNVNNVTITSVLDITADVAAYGIALSGSAAGGASVSYLTIAPTVRAYVQTGAIINIKGNLNVSSYYNVDELTGEIKANVVKANAYAGSAAVYLGVAGASVIVDIKNGIVEAYITGASINTGGSTSVVAFGYFNVNTSAGGIGVGGLAGIGAVVVTVTNNALVKAHIDNTNINANTVIVISKLQDSMTVIARGVSGGILAAGNAQVAILTDNASTYAYITGSGSVINAVNSNANILIQAISETKSDVQAIGYSIAGFVSGGASVIVSNITKNTKAYVDNGVTLKSIGDITIVSSSESDNDAHAQASSAALGGSGAGASITLNVTNITQTVIGNAAILTADDDITLDAITNKNDTNSYSSAIAGAILAVGVAISTVNVVDTTEVIIGDNTSVIAFGDLYIEANAVDYSISHAIGGAGGAFTGNAVEATLNTTENSTITTGTNAFLKATSGNVYLYSRTSTYGLVKTEIDFSVDITSYLKANSNGILNINALINLGTGTSIIAGGNVTVWAEVEKIDYYAWSRMETTSVLYTKACPTSNLSTVVHATINGNKITLNAGGILTLMALVDSDVSIKTYSYGYTAGTLGSIISTCSNTVTMYGTITISDAGSVLKGKDISITASSPRESQVVYTKDATYKAYTVSEFVSKAITKTKQVIEYVSEKICKYLPWPLNKIVKWVVKAVTKIITWIEYIVVEVILQSKCENYTYGSYNSSNNINLNGNIYYGHSAPINIVINADGSVSGVTGMTSTVSGENVILSDFSSIETGKLNITSTLGTISGNVTIHNNSIIEALNITNNSNYNLIINDISMMANEDSDSGNYNLNCAINNLEMDDTTDVISAPTITITDTQGKNITFNGIISCYAADLTVRFLGISGNICMTSNAQLDVNVLTVMNANNVGTGLQAFTASMFISSDIYGNAKKPKITINAKGDIYSNITLKQFLDSSATVITSLDGFTTFEIVAGGICEVTVNGGILLTSTDNTTSVGTISYDVATYSYEYTEIADPIIATLKLSADGTYKTVYVYTQDYTDAKGIFHSLGSEYTYDTNVYKNVSYKLDSQTYYLVNNITKEQTLISDPIAISVESITVDGVTTQVMVYRYSADYTDAKGVFHAKGSEYSYDTTSYFINLGQVIYKYSLVKEIITINKVTVAVSDMVTNSSVSASTINTSSNMQKVYGSTVKITANNTDSSKLHNLIINDVTGNGIVTIDTRNATNLIINGNITCSNNSIQLNVSGNLKFTATGIIGNIAGLTTTEVSITSGTMSTDKSTGLDILGKAVTIALNGNMGSSSNPIRIQTNTDGLVVDGLASSTKSDIYISDNNKHLYLYSIMTNGNVYLTTANVVNVASIGDTNIVASALYINSSGMVGAIENALVTNIGDLGITILSANDTTIRQVERTAYLIIIKSIGGNISVSSQKDIYATDVTAAGTAKLYTDTGYSLYNSSMGNAVTGTNIIMVSGNGIGTSSNALMINLGTGSVIAQAINDIYITDSNAIVIAEKIESANGNIVLKVEGLKVGTIVAENGAVTIIASSGNIEENNTVDYIKAKAISLTASGTIGTLVNALHTFVNNNGSLTALSNKAITINNTGNVSELNVNANEDITITSSGTLVANLLKAGTNYTIRITTTSGDITNNAGTLDTVFAKNIIMTSAGSIGSKLAPIRIALGSGELTAVSYNDISIVDNADAVSVNTINSTQGNIYLTTTGDLIVKSISAKNEAVLNSNGTIQGLSTYSGANISSNAIELHAMSIGTIAKAILTNVGTGGITAITTGDIYMKDIGGNAIIVNMISSAGNIYFESTGTTNIISMQADATITSKSAGNLTIGTITASEVYLETTNSGSVIAGTTISDTVPNINAEFLQMISAGAIGSSIVPITTNMYGTTCSIMGQAQGNISITDLYGEVTIKGLVSNSGGIILITNGTTRVETATAKEDITLTAMAGAMNLIKVITEAKATITAANDAIRNVASSSIPYNVKAADVKLSAFTTIGLMGTPLLTDADTLVVQAGGKIVIEDIGAVTITEVVTTNMGDAILTTNGNTIVNSIVIAGDLEFVVNAGNILNGNADDSIVNIFANSITIKANQLGTATGARYLVVSTGTGNLNINAIETSYIKAISTKLNLGNIVIGTVGAYNDFYLLTEVDTVNGLSGDNTNITAKNIILNASKSTSAGVTTCNFGAPDKAITINIDSASVLTIMAGRNVYISEKENLNVRVEKALSSFSANATGDINYIQLDQDANIGQIITSSNVMITANNGSIMNAASDSQTNVTADCITLDSVTGSIGAENKKIVVSMLTRINASTNNKSINLYGYGDLKLDTINAVGTSSATDEAIVRLTAQNSILNTYAVHAVNIVANKLFLTTETGTIGIDTANIAMDLRDNANSINQLNITAADNVYIQETTGDLGLGIIVVSGENFALTCDGNIYTTLNETDMNNNIANICAKTIILISTNGQIGFDTNSGQSYFEEDYAGWITTSTDKNYKISATAKGDIFIREIVDSLNIAEITTSNGDVNISAYNDVVSYNTTGSKTINISATNIYVETTKGIISTNVYATGDVIFNSYGSITNLKGNTVDMILIQGNNITLLSKAGGIGQEDSLIAINTSDSGILNVDAYLSVYVREISDNLTIGSVASHTGDVMFEVVDGDFVGTYDAGNADIVGNNCKIVTLNGSIGSRNTNITLDINGNLDLSSSTNIFLTEIKGDMLINKVIAGNEIYLTAQEDIIMSESTAKQANTLSAITGKTINLTAEASIGQKNNLLTIALKDNGKITANAGKSIYIVSHTTNVTLDQFNAANAIVLETDHHIYNGSGDVNLSANTIQLIAGGQIGTQDKKVSVVTKELIVKAKESIYISTPKELSIAKMISENGSISAIANGDILIASGYENSNNIYGINITLQSQNGSIGTSLNAITMDSVDGTITAYALNNIYLKEITGDILVNALTAGKTIQLLSPGSILSSNSNIVNIFSDVIVLTAFNQIGKENNALTINAGDLTATANGNIYLYSGLDMNINAINGKDIYLTTNKSVIRKGSGITIAGNALVIYANENIGSIDNTIQVSCNVLEAYAGGSIYLQSANLLNVSNLKAAAAYLYASSIQINMLSANETIVDASIISIRNLSTDRLTLKNAMLAGDTNTPLNISVNTLLAVSCSTLVINNDKSVIVEQMDASSVTLKVNGVAQINNANVDTFSIKSNEIIIGKVQSRNIDLTAGTIISASSGLLTAGQVRVNAVSSLGVSKANPFLMNAGYLTGSVTNGSAYIKNNSSIQVEELLAADAVYLFVNGNVTGIGTAVRALRLVFETSSFSADTVVTYIEGNGFGDITIINKGRTVLGNADDSYNGVTSLGEISITARSPIEVYETVNAQTNVSLTAGTSTTMEDSVKIFGLANIVALGDIIISAGDNIVLDTGTTIKGQTVSLTGGQSGVPAGTSIIVKGNIVAKDTAISGTDQVVYQISDDMGDVSITNCNTIAIISTTKNEELDIYSDRLMINGHKIQLSQAKLLEITNPGGNDVFTLYDTPCKMNISTGNGTDTFYIGRMVEESANAVKTTDGWLSNGISHAVTINTSGGIKKYVIYSVQDLLTINGTGNDSLFLKAFIEITDEGKLVVHKNAVINAIGMSEITIIKAGLFDKIAFGDGMLEGSGYQLNYDGSPTITIEKRQTAEGATDEMSFKQLLVYTWEQLVEYGYIYYIIAFIGVLGVITGVGIAKVKRSRRKIS